MSSRIKKDVPSHKWIWIFNGSTSCRMRLDNVFQRLGACSNWTPMSQHVHSWDGGRGSNTSGSWVERTRICRSHRGTSRNDGTKTGRRHSRRQRGGSKWWRYGYDVIRERNVGCTTWLEWYWMRAEMLEHIKNCLEPQVLHAALAIVRQSHSQVLSRITCKLCITRDIIYS